MADSPWPAAVVLDAAIPTVADVLELRATVTKLNSELTATKAELQELKGLEARAFKPRPTLDGPSSKWGKASTLATTGKLALAVKSIEAEVKHTWRCKRHKSYLHDVFISYRVAADGKYAAELADVLGAATDAEGKSSTVFFDSHCLNDGEDWEMGFLNGLGGSAVVLLLISEACLEGIKANASTRQDNVLLEWERALGRQAEGKNRLLPLFVAGGTYSAAGDADGKPGATKFASSFRFPRVDDFPDASHACPRSSGKTVRETVAAVLKLQGVMVDVADPAMAVPPIMAFLGEFDVVVHPGQLIMDGIKRCRDGGQILVRPGTYREDLDLGAKHVQLYGQSQAIITGTVTSHLAKGGLDGFSLSRLIIASGCLAVTACQFGSDDAAAAAASVHRAATPVFRKCIFRGCAGGAIDAVLGPPPTAAPDVESVTDPAQTPRLQLHDCRVVECGGDAAVRIAVAPFDAGASFEATALTVCDCAGTGLAVTARGAGLHVVLRALSIRDCGGAGLAVEVSGPGATVSVTGGDVRDCGLHGLLFDFHRPGCSLEVSSTTIAGCVDSGLQVMGEHSDVAVRDCKLSACGAPPGATFSSQPAPKKGAPRRRISRQLSLVDAASLVIQPSTAETQKTAGVALSCVRGFSITGCEVTECLTAIAVESVESGEIARNRLSQCQYGVRASVYFGIRLLDNDIESTTVGGISLAAGLDEVAEIRGNRIRGNAGAGVLVWRGAAVGSLAAANDLADNGGGDVMHQDAVFVPLLASFDWALSVAPEGGTIILAIGTFVQRLCFAGKKSVTVRARRAGETVIVSPTGGGACVSSSCEARVTLHGAVLRGMAIAAEVTAGELILQDLTITCGSNDSAVVQGTGLLVTGGCPTVDGCTFLECETGIRVHPSGSVAIVNSKLVSCKLGLEAQGGHVDPLRVTRSQFSLNRVGVAVCGTPSDLELDGFSCYLDSCHLDSVEITGQGASVDLQQCEVTRGGLQIVRGGSAQASGCNFTGCTVRVKGDGSAVHLKDGCKVLPLGVGAVIVEGGGAAAHASGVHIEDGGTAVVEDTTIDECTNGVTVTDARSRCEMRRVAVTKCDVSGVNAFKGAQLVMEACTIKASVFDGVLLANGAVASLTDCTVTGCKRCGLCVLPDCRLEALRCTFEGNANGVHIGGRMARWFGRGGFLGRLVRCIGTEECLRSTPGMCCIWRTKITTSSGRLVDCRLLRNTVSGVHAWMAAEDTLSITGSEFEFEDKARGIVLSGPRGWLGIIKYGRLARQLLSANKIVGQQDRGLTILLEAYAADTARNKDEQWTFDGAAIDFFTGFYLGLRNLRQKFRGWGPGGGYELNQVYSTVPLKPGSSAKP